MYVDVCDNNCNNLNFAFGNTGVKTAIPNRAFSIKVQRKISFFPFLIQKGEAKKECSETHQDFAISHNQVDDRSFYLFSILGLVK